MIILFTTEKQINLDAINIIKVSLHRKHQQAFTRPTCYVKLEFDRGDAEYFELEAGEEILKSLHKIGFYTDEQYSLVIHSYRTLIQDLNNEIEDAKQSHQK